MSAGLVLALLLAAPPGASPAVLPGRAGALVARAPAQTFRGAELYGHIDGGAEVFLELGFERLEVLDYSDGREELQLELYRMTDSAASLGIFLLRGGTLAAAAGGARVLANRFQTTLQRGRILAIITNPAGSERLAPVMLALARELAAATPAEEDPAVLALLPASGRVAGSERIIRGPVSMAALITLGDGDVLSLGGTVTAAAADVREGPTTAAVIVVPYPGADQAASALAELPPRLDRGWTRGEGEGDELSFTDGAGRRLVVSRDDATLLLRLTASPAAPAPPTAGR